MKQKLFCLTLFSIIAIAIGCNNDSTSKQLDKIESDTKQAAADMKDYSYAQKDAFVKKMQEQLDALKKDLDQLSAKIEASSDKVKAEAKPKLDALRAQQGQLSVQLDKVKAATESTWENVKVGFKSAYESSKAGFNSARQWVSDKVAP
ncbi:MAG: sll1863 family stress response protein [Limisphaerales bacterium]